MNAPAVACAIANRRYSLRLASKSGVSDNQSVISVPSCTGPRRSARHSAVAIAKARRSARLAKLPRVSYVGMDGDEE